MGKVMPTDRVTTLIDRFIRMEANDCSREEKLKELFGITPQDPMAHAADCKMTRWRKHPLYRKIWDDEIRRQDYKDYAASRQVLRKQLKNDNDWAALQAAQALLNNVGKKLYAEDGSTVNVVFSGMPELGSPEQEDG